MTIALTTNANIFADGATEVSILTRRKVYTPDSIQISPNTTPASALIVGAGPVGLTAALELHRRGAEIHLIEKSADRSELSKAVGINARSLELLNASGVTARLLAAGLKVKHINIRDGEDILVRVDFSKLPGPYNFLLSLPQSETERILEEALFDRGVAIQRQTELIDFAESDGAVEARLSGGNSETRQTADYIIGCDGAHSTVRKKLGLGFPGEPYPESWSLADVRMEWPFGHGDGNLFMERGNGVLFVISLPEDRFRVIANVPDALSLLPSRSHVSEIFWQTDFTVSLRQVESYGKGRAFLAGDAAHIHTPAGGRGMNLGIEDASVLAERIATGGLETYTRDRHRAGRQVVRESDLQFRAANLRNPVLKGLRNSVMRTFLTKECVQARFRLRMAGLETTA